MSWCQWLINLGLLLPQKAPCSFIRFSVDELHPDSAAFPSPPQAQLAFHTSGWGFPCRTGMFGCCEDRWQIDFETALLCITSRGCPLLCEWNLFSYWNVYKGLRSLPIGVIIAVGRFFFPPESHLSRSLSSEPGWWTHWPTSILDVGRIEWVLLTLLMTSSEFYVHPIMNRYFCELVKEHTKVFNVFSPALCSFRSMTLLVHGITQVWTTYAHEHSHASLETPLWDSSCKL